MTIPREFKARDALSVMRAFADTLETVDVSEAFEEIVTAANSAFDENFTRTMGAGGYSWPRHAPYTVRLYGPHPLLKLTGEMHRSITQRHTPDRIEEIKGRSMVLGTSKPYAWKHQFGDPWNFIPQRMFLWMPAVWVDRLASQFADVVYRIVIERQSN